MSSTDEFDAVYDGKFAGLLLGYLSDQDRNQSWLASKLGVSAAAVSRWINNETRPGNPETVIRICDVLNITAASDRQSMLAAAGYGYQELPPPERGTSQPAAIDPDELAIYLEIVRTKHRFLETRPYRNLSELSGPAIRMPLLDEDDRPGVYTPLRYDLHLARETFAGELGEAVSQDRLRAVKQLERAGPRTDVDLRDVLVTPGHVALIGKAGCGKTTALRLVATVLAEQDKARARQWLGWTEGSLPVPVYLALRDFEHACQKRPGAYGRNVDGFLRYLDDQFAEWHPGRLPKGFLERLVRSGQAWLLIDALDEVPDFDHRIDVRRTIEGLASEFSSNRMLVTARVAAYTHANTRLDDRFNVATVRDLTAQQWTPVVERLYGGLEADPDVARQRAARLLQRIASSDLLRDMVKTPLMVWTATLIDSTGRELPEQRAELYNAYTEVLLGERLKEEESAEAAKMLREDRWPKNDRRLYLTYAAFETHEAAASDRATESRDRALVVVNEHDLADTILAPYLASYLGLTQERARQEARAFIQVMAERSGILHAQSGGYSFGDHLTVQEFLAASYLVDNLRTDPDKRQQYRAFIGEHVGQSWWQEVFLLAAGYLLRNPDQAKRFLENELGGVQEDGDARAYGLAWAGRAMLEIPAERVGWHDAVRSVLAQRLVRALEQNPPTSSVAARIEAGQVLSRLGDPRFAGPFSLPEFVAIPGGVSWMGSEQAEVDRLIKETDNDWYKLELPRHQVKLSPFALARYPTTNAMFRHFLVEAQGYRDARWWAEAKDAKVWRPDGTVKDRWNDVRSQPAYWEDERWNGANQPVVGVTWYEAVAYCRWLTAALADGFEYRLPTEAEWERAARGPDGWRYPWGNDWADNRANSKELNLERTTPVGIFPDGASREGVLDLSGNVWEWCNDWYGEDTYFRRKGRIEQDPFGPAKGQSKLLRGGSWYSDRTAVRCASRLRDGPGRRDGYSGFRVARGPLTKHPVP